MDLPTDKILWRAYRESLERRGLLLVLIAVAVMLLLASISEYHPQPAIGYYGHKGLMNRVWHLQVPLWSTSQGARVYLPYEYVFCMGIVLLGIGITLVAMGTMPDPEVKHIEDEAKESEVSPDC